MKFRKLGIILAIIMCFALVSAGCASTTSDTTETAAPEDSLQRVLDAGQLTVVGSGGYPPFNYIDENGDVIGFDVDVGAEIAARLGVELNYVTGEWSGLIEGLRAGRYDGILGSMAVTEERLQTVNFSIPYYYSGAQLIVRSDSGIADPGEMEGQAIAVATGTNYVEDAEGLGAEAKLYDDDTLTMMELIAGRVDGVVTDRLVALEAMNGLEGGDELELCGEIMRLESMGIAIRQEDVTLLEAIDEILQEMHDDGTLTAISEEWLGGDVTVK